MTKKPPVYTFRRPRKTIHPEPRSEMYTVIEDTESEQDQTSRYIRYIFFLVLLIVALSILGMSYIYFRGIPVKFQS